MGVREADRHRVLGDRGSVEGEMEEERDIGREGGGV